MNLTRTQALAGIAGGLVAASGGVASAQTPLPIRIGTSLSDPFLQPFYAQDEGFYKQAGLNADVQVINNGDSITAVVGGAMDIGTSDLTQIANAYNKGVDLAIVASGAYYDSAKPTISLCVNKNSPYMSAKDLEGQTIAVPNLKSSGGISIQEWLSRSGVDITKVKFLEIQFPAMGPALASNRVAAALNGEPFLTDSKNDIRRLVNPYDFIAKNFYTGLWYGKKSWLNANVPTAKAYINATYATARWANAHQNDSAVIAARVTKVDPDKVKSFVRNAFATSLDPKLAQPLLDLAFKYKVIEKPTKASDLFWSPPA